MLLSHRYRFLFVHIAKTGGTSVRGALQSYRWRDPYYLPQFIASKLSGLVNHEVAIKLPRHCKAITAQEMLPREFYDSLFKFAFVRNPWDLQVSSYHHIKRERPHLLEPNESFAEFLRRKLDPERPWQYHIDTSITPQTDYLIDLHGNLIVDFIGRYESLKADFDTVCDHIGIPRKELPHKRKATDRTRYREYYDESTRDLVAQHFAADIERLGYEF
ncbi:MAG: sulfotransferase family 2 domain-containing protein [Halieaceae bacterium]|jgi:hypothetical protein|nr:sulfotransferase family 2 domain-containing protein [Halieaceae bacterium]